MVNPLTTLEDYLDFTGVNLESELEPYINNYEGTGNPALLFVYEIEEWCKDYLMENYDFDGNPSKNPTREKKFKQGVIYQIQYVIANGDIHNESGYNRDTNTLIPRMELNRIAMGEDALRCFRLGGMANFRRM